MRSKWLRWTPEVGSVGFEGSAAGDSPIARAPEEERTQPPVPSQTEITEKAGTCEPTKPTKPVTAQSERLLERPSYFWGRHGDYYGWRVHVALEAICGTLAPEGLIVWLGEHSPFLYRRLTSDLPDKISRAWDAKVSVQEFDALCSELVESYRRAAELYGTAERNGKRDAHRTNS